MPDSIKELKKRLEAIKDMGFVKTHRAGGTGIGKTLEDLLGMGHEKKGVRVRHFEDFDAFLKYTGMMIEETDWGKVGIYPDNENGTFDIHRLQELKDFCAKKPRKNKGAVRKPPPAFLFLYLPSRRSSAFPPSRTYRIVSFRKSSTCIQVFIDKKILCLLP